MSGTSAPVDGPPAQPGLVSGVVAQVEDLHVSFETARGTVQALRGVSLSIQEGEVIGIVGESGSGKSVLASSLLGLVSRQKGAIVSGAVRIAGVDMLDPRSREVRGVLRKRLGAVFQDPLSSLDPTMRIKRQLTERGISEARAVENLRDAGVPEPERRAQQFPHELSGGLRQRVAIAQALGTPPLDADRSAVHLVDKGGVPQLILADEPTTALDVSVQAQVVLLFDKLRREHGCAVVFVTHDLGVAASICDRILVLYAGRVCEVGPAADVLERPTHHYTRALLASRISVDTDRSSVIKPIVGSPPNPLMLPSGCAFAPRCPRAAADCEAALPELTPRAPRSGAGSVACLHPAQPDEPIAGAEGNNNGSPTRRRAAPVAAPARAAEQPALELRNISKTFHIKGRKLGLSKLPVHAVADVSLSVPPGGAVALVGESGCGKTTTLRMACGLVKPDAGEVLLPPGARRPQLIFQDAGSSLTPWMTVGSMLSEQLAQRDVPSSRRRESVLELLARVGLDERAADAKARDLSGGQRQRAGIARALASDPQVLICDEPVSALDASLAIRVLDLLAALRRDLGLSLLVVTHDLGVARRVADEVAVMYRGKIIEQGPTDVVFERPRHPYTEGLIAAIPTTEPGRLSPTLAGEPASPIGTVEGCAFRPRCPRAADRCLVEAPLLREVGADRLSACHFAEEL